jgi:hypothetical protein
MKKTIYLSGKMSGEIDLNFPLFNSLTAQLRAIGYDVINPVEINSDPSAAWLTCIKADIEHVARCQMIAMIPGWEASFGARIERLVAEKLGLEIVNVYDLFEKEAA